MPYYRGRKNCKSPVRDNVHEGRDVCDSRCGDRCIALATGRWNYIVSLPRELNRLWNFVSRCTEYLAVRLTAKNEEGYARHANKAMKK